MDHNIRCYGCSKILMVISSRFGESPRIDECEEKIYCEDCKNPVRNIKRVSFEDLGKMHEIYDKRLKEGEDPINLLRDVVTDYLKISYKEYYILMNSEEYVYR